MYIAHANFMKDEYPLSTFDNMTVTEIKKKGYFKGMSANEQSALGLILSTAREFRTMCREMPQEKLENHEHAAVADTIKAMLDRSEKEARDLTKQKTDELKAEIQKLIDLSERRLKSGPDWDREFAKKLSTATVNPQEAFGEILVEIAPPPRSSYPNLAEVSAPDTTTPLLPHMLTLARKPPTLQEPTGRESATGRESTTGRASSFSWAYSPVHPQPVGLATPLSFLNFINNPGPGKQKHIRVFPVEPVLRGVTGTRLQDSRLSGHIVARLKVRPVPLADVVVRHEAHARGVSGRRVGRDMTEGVAAVGGVEFRVRLQPVSNQVLEEVAEHLLLPRLPLLILADGVPHAGVAEKHGDYVMSGLGNLYTEPAGIVFDASQGHGDGWKG